MLIVRCRAGLGNQMHQYAFYYALKTAGYPAKFDTTSFNTAKYHNGYELVRAFNLTADYASLSDVERLSNKTLTYKIMSRLKLSRFYCLNKHHLVQDEFNYNKKYFHLNGDYFLDGFWQSEKYFYNCIEQIRKIFKFVSLDNQNQNIAHQIQNCNAVSIHIRRGDYLHEPDFILCSLNYYIRAMKYMCDNITNVQFYIFSDDIPWCKENLSGIDNNIVNTMHYITHNTGIDSYKDMYLMSLCKHNIIANSSFSWWGAYLNHNLHKIVIAPSKWFPHHVKHNTIDLIPKSWIKMESIL